MNTYSSPNYFKSIWLFTYSDLKTIVIPKSIFGVLSAISSSVFSIHSTQTAATICQRAPVVLFWTWINLLPININNQRQPAAVMEDSINKPWRPMPSKMLTPTQARNIMLVFYPIAVISSHYLGGLRQCVSLIFLGYWYNNLGGADTSWITRNMVNAAAFISFSSGAMEVALGFPLQCTPKLLYWLCTIGGVVFSTVHMQDMFDQAGDSLRNRKTLPLVVGDSYARWMTVFPMIFWSVVCPWLWSSPLAIASGYFFLGSAIVWRTLMLKSVKEDKITYKVWNVWIVSLYMLPLINFFGGDLSRQSR
jgi:4-hydroxybenzoate polyprenyltransferase